MNLEFKEITVEDSPVMLPDYNNVKTTPVTVFFWKVLSGRNSIMSVMPYGKRKPCSG